MKLFLGRVGVAALATPIIKFSFMGAGVAIAWWLAAVIALVLVFVGDWIATADGDVL